MLYGTKASLEQNWRVCARRVLLPLSTSTNRTCLSRAHDTNCAFAVSGTKATEKMFRRWPVATAPLSAAWPAFQHDHRHTRQSSDPLASKSPSLLQCSVLTHPACSSSVVNFDRRDRRAWLRQTWRSKKRHGVVPVARCCRRSRKLGQPRCLLDSVVAASLSTSWEACSILGRSRGKSQTRRNRDKYNTYTCMIFYVLRSSSFFFICGLGSTHSLDSLHLSVAYSASHAPWYGYITATLSKSYFITRPCPRLLAWCACGWVCVWLL